MTAQTHHEELSMLHGTTRLLDRLKKKVGDTDEKYPELLRVRAATERRSR